MTVTVPNVYPANLQALGWSPETVYGTPAGAPTVWIPIDTPQYTPNIAPLTDQAGRGSMGVDSQQQQGLRADSLTYSTYLYLDSAFLHCLAALGTPDVISGSGDPYTHKTSLYSAAAGQPRSSTLWYTDGSGNAQRMPGAQIVDLKFTIDVGGLVKLDVTWMSLPATAVTPPTNTPGTLQPMPAWSASVTVGGVSMGKYSNVTLDYKRNTEMVPAMNGTQTPAMIFAGPAQGTGSLTGIYQGSADNDFAGYLANTQPSLVVKMSPPGSATHGLTLQHSVVAYDSVVPSGTNKWMEVKSTLKLILNSTDAVTGSGGESFAQAILTSAQSTAY